MTNISTYLTFNGNCEVAFNFYKSVFGGDFTHIGKFKDMPEDPKYPVSESNKEKIMHVSYPIGNTMLMGSDTGGEWSTNFKQGNNFSISVNTDNMDEADKLFNKLSEGGKVIMPMNKTFWDSYFGMLTDQFGIQWMVSFNANNRNK
ncbi:PhnB protein [Saccharicrinis carchari]|uniref:PhnB protein n=1 Tax=Saccharicrinis carchari TaxID=1168039 RepID=A0A521ATG6_SACCC|nr:VOC family protein [Saccharicrinis carchari]SMO38104.1 PhnB protein [Saccharicrinis carchari]